MMNLTLTLSVHTLDYQTVLPAGTVLSDDVLDSLAASNRTKPFRTGSMLSHAGVKKDLLRFLSQPPYNVIFVDQTNIAEVFDLIHAVQIALPVLQSLDYFKQKDFHTYRHVLVVSALSTLLAKDMMSDNRDRIVEAATGPSHDIGKVCVPVNILQKVDPLTKTERDILKQHTVAGYALLSYYLKDSNHIAARVARDHHERNDASGYPRGIRLNDLMVEIITVCDVYDALISSRPYRPAPYDNRTAIEEITAMAETGQIGWEVLKALVARNRKAKDYEDLIVSREKRGTPPKGNVYGLTAPEKDKPSD